ncbi:glycosyltransferase family 2 protein [Clostridium perfringens]|nr:glycosyltransferase family 2 protein [Clostridium perfringens]
MYNYEKGLVSVIMPTYKRSDKIDRAIESILNQTYKNLELILVNDNVPGDDFSVALIEKVKKYEVDSRFRLILQEKHINGAVARNIGIKLAKGEYIAFLDDDDWWKPEKIARQVEAISKLSDEWGVVSCRIEQFDNNTLIAKLPKYRDGYVYKDILMHQCDFATGTLLFRHNSLDEAGYFDESLFRNQDWQLLTNVTYKYKLYQINEFLHCCDISDNSNRPNGDNIVIYKKAFFKSIEPIFNTLTKREQNCIMCISNFEIGYVYYLSGDIWNAMNYCFKILKSPRAILCIGKKFLKKLQSKNKIIYQ